MGLWTAFVDLIQSLLFAATQACGGNLALGILAAGIGLRLALLPVTYRIAREAQQRSLKMAAIRPELTRIQKAYRDDMAGLAAAQMALFKRHDLKLFDGRSILGSLIQMPFVLAMYSAVRTAITAANPGKFLWIQNIARPDFLLAVSVSALTYGMMLLAPQTGQQGSKLVAVIPAIITFVILLKFSAGLGLYWGASSAVGIVQGLVLKRARTS